MMKVKKLFLSVIVLCFLFSISSVYAQEGPYTSIVTALGVVGDEKDLQGNITRGEAAGYILRLCGYDEDAAKNAANGANVFDDVVADTQTAWDVTAAYHLKYINGTSEKTFSPDDFITGHEILKIVVSALGYDTMAQSLGGYPQGYVLASTTIGLTKGSINFNEEFVTKEDAIKLFENALNADMMEKSYGTREEYKVVDGKTLLNTVFNVEKRTGVVKAGSQKQLLPKSAFLKKGDVQIDDTFYLEGDSNISELAGYTVEYYIRKDEKNDTETVLFAKEKNNTVIEIDAENIENTTVGSNYVTVGYRTNEKSRKTENVMLKFDETTLVYNGLYCDIRTNAAAMLKPDNGKMTLIDNNRDGVYEYVFVESYTVAVVKDYSPSSETIYFSYPVDLSFSGEYADVSINLSDSNIKLTLDGDFSLEKLTENNVLSIYQTIDENGLPNKYVRIVMCDDKMDSVLQEVNYLDGIDDFVIDGNNYKLTKEFKNYLGSNKKLPLGADCTVFLSADGKIAYFNNYDSENRLYGFLTKAAIKDGVDGVAQFRVFTQNGIFETFDLAEKVEFVQDGVKQGKINSADIVGNMYNDVASKVTYESDVEFKEAFGTPPPDGTVGNPVKLNNPSGVPNTAICFVENLGLATEPGWNLWGFGNYSGQTDSSETGRVILKVEPTYDKFDKKLPVNLSFLALAIPNFDGAHPNAVNNKVAAYVSKVENPNLSNPDFKDTSVWEEIALIKNSPPGYPLSYNFDITNYIDGFENAYVAFEVTSTAGTWGYLSNVVINQGYHSGNYIFGRENMKLIRFGLSRDNKINILEYADNVPTSETDRLQKAENNDFTLSHKKQNYYYYVYPSMVMENDKPLYGISPDTVVFNIPGDPMTADLDDMKEDAFKIQSLPLIGPGTNYVMASYDEDEVFGSKIIVNYNSAGEPAYDIETSFLIVDKVTSVVDKDGNNYTKLTGWIDGSLREYKSGSDENAFVKTIMNKGKLTTVPLQKGDIITIPYILNGEVKRVSPIFTVDTSSPNGFGYTFKYDINDSNLTNPTLNTDFQIPAFGPTDLTIVDGIVVAKSDQYLIIKSPIDDSNRLITYLGSPFIRVTTVNFGKEMKVDTSSTSADFHIGDYVVIRQKSTTNRDCIRYTR